MDGVEACSVRASALYLNLPVIFSSDAHRPGEIGSRYTRFLVEDPTASEIGMALGQVEGRRILAE